MPAAAAAAIVVAVAGSSFAVGGMLGRPGDVRPRGDHRDLGPGGPIDALVLPCSGRPPSRTVQVDQPRSSPFRAGPGNFAPR